MPRFAYRALAEGCRLVEGQMTSGTRERALDVLRRRRLVPVGIEEVVASGRIPGVASLLRPRAMGPAELLDFTRDLQVLVDAGVPLGRALAILTDPAAGTSAVIAQRLLAQVRDGRLLSAAMGAEPALFPSHYVGMVRAGEEGSALGAVLGHLAAMLERAASLRAQIRSGLAYPMLVLFLAGLTMLIMLVLVLPELRPIFERAGEELPLPTRALMGASELVRDSGWAIAAASSLLLLMLLAAARSKAGRLALDWLLLRLPVLGGLLVKVEAARFCRTLGTLVVNDVALVEAARIATDSIANRQLAGAMPGFVAGLTRGEDVGHALGRAGWLPPRVLRVVAVGGESGRVGEMLVRIAEMYEVEAGRTMQRLVGMITPVTTLLLGGLIGLMVWSVISTVLGSYTQVLQ